MRVAKTGEVLASLQLYRYGYEVLVVESHTSPGGAAHHWSRGQFNFDSGAALFSGINPTLETAASGEQRYNTTANPLSSVLAAIDETVPSVIDLPDRATCLVYPDGKQYRTQLGSEKFTEVVKERLGAEAAREWTAFQDSVKKLCTTAGAIPPAAVRLDPGVNPTEHVQKSTCSSSQTVVAVSLLQFLRLYQSTCEHRRQTCAWWGVHVQAHHRPPPF